MLQALQFISYFNYKYVFFSAPYLKFVSLKILHSKVIMQYLKCVGIDCH